MLNKKGISPLIATVLIIGFVIILAFIIFAFTRGIIEEQKDEQGETFELYSEGANFYFVAQYNADPDVDQTKILVTNDGDVPLYFVIKVDDEVFGPEYIFNDASSEFPVGTSISKSFFFSGEYSSATLVPHVMYNDELTALPALAQDREVTVYNVPSGGDEGGDSGWSSDSENEYNDDPVEVRCIEDLGGICHLDGPPDCLFGEQATPLEGSTDCIGRWSCWACVET